MLKVENLNVSIAAMRILRDVSLEVPSGAMIGLIGRNGAGKTTVMKAVMGLLKASGGIRFDEVDLTVAPGEAVGLIGRNGAGKTSTLRCLAGIVPLDSGRAECGGRVVSLLELGAGFGPEFSGRENIYLNGALHEAAQRYAQTALELAADPDEATTVVRDLLQRAAGEKKR